MGARQRLTLLACASGAVLILLGRTAHSAAEQLATVPPQSWGLSELSDAVVAGTCACGTLGALWHVVSALVALMALAGEKGPGPHGLGGTSTLRPESWRPGERLQSDASPPQRCSSPCPRRPRWPLKRPAAGTIWDGAPPARPPPHRRRSPRRRRRLSSPRRALRPVLATRRTQASQRTRRRRAARRRSPLPAPTPHPPRAPLIPSRPARACGRSLPTYCPPAPAQPGSRRPGRPCIAPTPRRSAPTRP